MVLREILLMNNEKMRLTLIKVSRIKKNRVFPIQGDIKEFFSSIGEKILNKANSFSNKSAF